MVVVGIVLLVMVVRVSFIGVVGVVSGGVVDILVLGGVFLGGGGEGSGTGGGMCCEAYCEAGSVVCEWEGIVFVLL